MTCILLDAGTRREMFFSERSQNIIRWSLQHNPETDENNAKVFYQFK